MELKDKRLLLCAQMCEGDFVCDVGTDHGYLPAYLLSQGKCRRAIASDISAKPLEGAARTLDRAGVTEKARLILSDGLKNVPLEGVTDIVIAGMGGELITRILADERVRSGVNLVLQPMTRANVLRKFLWEEGFGVECERAVSHSRFVYSVIKCRYTGVSHPISCREEYIGRLDMSLPDDRIYIQKQLGCMERTAGHMKKSQSEKAERIMDTVRKIREELC